jgi:hypothetical protein
MKSVYQRDLKIMQYKLLTILFLLSISSNLFSQVLLSGKITDQNNISIPATNVFIKGTYIGTVSNRDGNFSISIPQKHSQATLCISNIGYQNQEISTGNIKSPLHIQLRKDTCNLAEVLVMPKDTLLALLRRAHGKIKDNYPNFDTRTKGLYREAFQIPHKNEYLYFGEAQLDIFKTSYRNKTEGQVKIVKSRMNKHPLYDSLSTVMWYGGVHIPIYSDEVKQRTSFISPKNFHKYNYNILSTKLNGQSVYKIEFHPNEKGRFKGAFYLNKSNLAYLYFEYTYTDFGQQKRSAYLSPNAMRNVSRNFITKYREVDGKYFLSYISDFETIYSKKLKEEMVQFNEFITTDLITQNVDAIPFSDQAQYRDVFFVKSQNIKESDWKGSNVLVPDSALSKLIEYSPQQSQQLLNKEHDLPKKYQFRKKLVEIITRLYFDVNLEYRASDNLKNVRLQYSPQSNQVFERTKNSSDPFYSFGMVIGYKLNPHFDVNFSTQESLGGNHSVNHSIGFAYETPIINKGKQLFLIGGMSFYFAQDGLHIGDFKSDSNFKAGGKKITADKIALYLGQKKQGLSFEMGLKTKVHKFYSLFVSGGYRMNLNKKDRLFIKEKSGFLLTRKTTDISLGSSKVQYFENDIRKTKTSFETSNFYLKAGIRIAL